MSVSSKRPTFRTRVARHLSGLRRLMRTQQPTVDQVQPVHTIHGAQYRNSYTYEPLRKPQSQIRLLHLRPERVTKNRTTSTSSDNELTFNCSIETIDLHHDPEADVPPYYAVSYVWGDATDLLPIICDGKVKEVTRNLWEVLLQVWQRTYGDLKSDSLSQVAQFGRPLWIDAICINQNDLLEKGQQVQQMGHIYRRAAKVLIWLGPHHKVAEDAQDVLVPLDTRGTFDYDPCPPRSGQGVTLLTDLDTKWESQVDREEMLELFDFILDLFSRDDWKCFHAFVALMNLEYWSRAWVVQEVALANHNEALVMTGGKIWAWATLVNASHTLMVIMYLFNTAKEWPMLAKWPKDKILTLRHHSVILDQFVSGTMTENLTLAEHIPKAIFRTTKATLLVDHIYSLLSPASDQQTCDIVPNYTKPVAEVYQDAARYLLRTISADALTFCELCRTSKLNLPSWVPNFSYHNVWTLKVPRPNLTGARLYTAGGQRERFSYQIQGTSLRLHGRRVDTICHFAQFTTQGNVEKDDATGWLREFQEFIDEAVQSHGTDSANAWRVPIADQIDVDQAVEVRAPAKIAEVYDELIQHDGIATLSRSAVNYAGALVLWGGCHPPFVTQKGYLGLGRPCAREGDVLWICTGADTPLIVREVQGNKFQIVAEAYLQGFMDGEILEASADEETIEII